MAFCNISRWLWRRRESKARPQPSTLAGASASSSSGPRKQEVAVSRRKSGVGKKACGSGGRGPLDAEFDGVIVPADGVCMSDSDSDDSDWSIGWFEPQSSEFSSETESERSFAVLVPCYALPVEETRENEAPPARTNQDPQTQLLHAVLSTSPSSDSKEYLQQWLDSLKSQ